MFREKAQKERREMLRCEAWEDEEWRRTKSTMQ